MAPKKRTPDQVQHELAAERESLSAAVDNLREATNVGRKLKAKLPVAAAGALGAGFFLAGGIGATVRLLFRRGRE
jgi:predicted ATPase